MILDRNIPKPLHLQLEEFMRQKMASGEWATGNLIPSENNISKDCGISRMTVRNVIFKLEQEGLVERVMGKGTYVSPQKMQGGKLKFEGIVNQLQQMGYTITTKLLSVEKKVIPKNTGLFSMPGDCVYYEIKRLRYMGEQPMSVHITHIPALSAPGLEGKNLEDKQLFMVLEDDYGLVRGKVSETWYATKAPKWVTEILQIKASQPVLMDKNVTYSLATQNVASAETEYFRGDKISLYFEF